MDKSSILKSYELTKKLEWKQEQLDQIEALYQSSIPNIKLYYPEPFIAAPSYIHNDIWYMHILIYWYWLWFFFISLIVFFFITFLCCLRWCNPRKEPKKETRGVSRSKCGDVVTCLIPVTWAISIIVSETTDAIDYFDGSKTTELIVGIRAYQWGWEYYYPKDLDINYKIKPTYSEFIGSSLKYEKSSSLKNNNNKMLNQIKLKKIDETFILPSLVLLPINSFTNILHKNFFPKNELNLDYSFKNATKYIKNGNFTLFQNLNSDQFYGIIDDSLINSRMFNSFNFKVIKKHNFLSLKALQDFNNNYFDIKILNNINFTLTKNKSESLYSVLSKNFQVFNSKNTIFLSLLNNFTSNKNKKKAFNLLFTFKNINTKEINFFNNLELNFNKISSKDVFFNKNLINFNYIKKSKINRIDDNLLINKNNFNPINFNINKKLSPFFIKKSISSNNIYFKNKSYIYNSTDLMPIYFNKGSLYWYNSSLSCPKNSENSYTSLDFTLDIGTQSRFTSLNWNTFYNVKNNYYRLNLLDSLVNKKSYTPLKTIFLYANYDFLDKDFIKSLDSILWENSRYEYLVEDLNSTGVVINNNKSYFKYFNTKYSYVNKKFINKINILDSIKEAKILLFTDIHPKSVSQLKLLDLSDFHTTSVIKSYHKNLFQYMYGANYVFNSNKNYFINFSNHIKPISTFNYVSFYKKKSEPLTFFNNNLIENNPQINNTYLSNTNSNIKNNLRLNSKEIKSDFNALKKVFKSKFDDFRSHNSIEILSSTPIKIPFVTSKGLDLSKTITKQANTITKVNVFSLNIKNIGNNNHYLFNLLNNYHFDFPFCLSQDQEQIKYVWFDWYSKWQKHEVQQANFSKLNLNGMPKFNKLYEFGDKKLNFDFFENYYSRLLFIRKNYYNISRFSPTVMDRSKDLSNNFSYLNIFKLKKTNKDSLLCNNMKSFFLSTKKKYTFSDELHTLNSGLNRKSKNFYNFYNNENCFTEKYSLLADILTKREFLVKNFYITKSKNVTYDKFLISSVNNYLFKELKSLYLIKNEGSFLKDLSNVKVYKSQYKPLRRGVSSMVRLQASNVISLPIETRIQILASSKDIIHSWAIPSAGIKIDCIPGYSSHRIIYFLLSGIYWGQCMEICGRYHHWMPIIAYFIKKDLFFLWCTHFVLSNKSSYINNYYYSNKYFKNNTLFIDKNTFIKNLN